MSSITIFIETLEKSIKNKSVSLYLTEPEKDYINILLKAETDVYGNPGIIYQIQREINSIVKDKKINTISKLILSIANILKSDILKNTTQNVSIIRIIEFILDSIFDSNILLLNSIEVILIRSLIDSSLELLNTNIEVVENNCSCCFFPFIFNLTT